MIYKKRIDVAKVRQYASTRYGNVSIQRGSVTYRLNYLGELAILGKTEELKKEIEQGAPVLGTDEQVREYLKQDMYVQVERKKSFIVGLLPEGGYYTTLEMAFLGGHMDTVQMLLEKGAIFDLRSERLRNILLESQDEEMLDFAFSCRRHHPDAVYYLEILDREAPNLFLIDYLVLRGVVPGPDILTIYYQMRYDGLVSLLPGHETKTSWKEDPIRCYFRKKDFYEPLLDDEE